MEDLFSYAKKYYEKWKVTPVPIIYNSTDNMQPLIKWGTIYEKNRSILIEDEKIWKRATGIAILPQGNHAVIDFDLPSELQDIKKDWMQHAAKDFVVVETRRGFHIHFEADRPVGEIRIYWMDKRIGEGGGSLCKHMWSVPPTRRGNFIYRFFNTNDIIDLPRLRWKDAKSTIETIYQCRLEEIADKKLTGKEIALTTEIIKGINQLSTEQLKILLFLIFHDMKCYGLRDLMYEWFKNRYINMKKFSWGRRTSRFYFLHTITAILALMGASHRKVAELLDTYEDLDGKPNDAHESALWTVYEWKQLLFRRLYVMKRGECPFCTIRGYRNCQKNPVLRFYYYLQSRGKEKIEEIVAKLLSNERS